MALRCLLNPWRFTLTADCQVPLPGSETSRGQFIRTKRRCSCICGGVEPDGLWAHAYPCVYWSVAGVWINALWLRWVLFGTDGALRLLAKKPDGAFVTYDM